MDYNLTGVLPVFRMSSCHAMAKTTQHCATLHKSVQRPIEAGKKSSANLWIYTFERLRSIPHWRIRLTLQVFVCMHKVLLLLQARFFQMEDNGNHNGKDAKAVSQFTGSHGTECRCFWEGPQRLKGTAITISSTFKQPESNLSYLLKHFLGG